MPIDIERIDSTLNLDLDDALGALARSLAIQLSSYPAIQLYGYIQQVDGYGWPGEVADDFRSGQLAVWRQLASLACPAS